MADILEVKKKHTPDLLKLEKVHGVGLRMAEQKIVVYASEITPELLLAIPHEIEGYLVDIVIADVPQSMVYRKPSGNFDANYKRPIPGGTGAGQANITTGTLGSWWHSNFYNTTVALSNNHVFADANRGKARRSATTSFTVLAGGTSFTPVLADKGLSNTDFVFDIEGGKKECYIDSVTPSSGKVGDVITIVGRSLGTRWGYGKVYFDGIEAPVKSWTGTATEERRTDYSYWRNVVTTIQVYVPVGLGDGPVTIEVEAEGDPAVSPGMVDYGVYPTHAIGELLDYQEYTDNQAVKNLGDVALIKPYDTNVVDKYIQTRPATDRPNYDFVNNTDIFNGYRYKPAGFFTQPVYEGLALMKTGRTSGTSFSYVVDTHYATDVGYQADDGGATFVHYDDCIWVSGMYDAAGNSMSDDMLYYELLYFLAPGDSGSSVFTAPQDLYDQFCTRYGVAKPANLSFATPFMFVGSCFAGGYDGYYNLVDKYSLWGNVAGFSLDTLDSDGSKSLVMSGNSSSTVKMTFSYTPVFQMSGQSTSSGSLSIQVQAAAQKEGFQLHLYTPPASNKEINFFLAQSGTVPVAPSTLSFRMSASGTSQGNAKVFVPFSFILPFTGQSSMKTLIYVFPVGWEEGTQREEIYLSITRSVELEPTITRSIELKPTIETSIELHMRV